MMRLIPILSLLMIVSCTSSKISTTLIREQAPLIIYKTNADYYLNVPVTLNKEKTMIVSYPDPSDLTYEGEPAYPLKLKKGYLLDRRGIGPNTVFTRYTYEEYAALKSAPSLDELYNSIIDKDPFVVIYDCGKRDSYKDLEKDLNMLIRKKCATCKKL